MHTLIDSTASGRIPVLSYKAFFDSLLPLPYPSVQVPTDELDVGISGSQ